MKRPTAQHGGARMKCNGDSLSLPLSLFLSQSYSCIIICAWQTADGRVTSDHCCVTVQWLFSKKNQIAWIVQKTLFDSRPTVAWPPTTVAWPFSDIFQKKFECLKRPKTLFDSRPTVAWPPKTVAWPFSDFFQKIPKSLETSKRRCMTVGRRSRDLRPLSRDRSVTFLKKIPNCLKRPKMLFDSRPTVAWPPTTVAWPFSDFFQRISKWLETSKKRCLTVGRRSRDRRPLSRDRSVTFFQKISKLLETSKKRCLTVGRRSRDRRPLSRDRSVTFFKKFPNCFKRPKKLFDSRPMVAWPPTTVA